LNTPLLKVNNRLVDNKKKMSFTNKEEREKMYTSERIPPPQPTSTILSPSRGLAL